MLDPETVQDGGMEIVDVDAVLDNVVSKVVRLAKSHSPPDASPRHPDAVASGVVIPSKTLLGDVPLAVGSAAKLPAPNYQGLIEKASLLEV